MIKENVITAIYNAMLGIWHLSGEPKPETSEKQLQIRKQQIEDSKETVEKIVKYRLPNSKGFKTKFNFEYSNPQRFVFDVVYEMGCEPKRKIMVFVFGRLNGLQVDIDLGEHSDYDLEQTTSEIYKEALEKNFNYSTKWYSTLVNEHFKRLKALQQS